MTECLHVRISGRVQGVGFRYSTADQARRLQLTGWVRNCPDGAVEAEFAGARDTLESMLTWCHAGPPGAHVNDVESRWNTETPEYSAFTIRG